MSLSLLSLENIQHKDINYLDFEQVKVYSDDEHFKRRLTRYKPTGELYFYEFKEEIDYVNGNDPQYRTYIPVKNEEEADEINTLDIFQIHTVSPRLIDDWHADDTRVTKWIL